MLVIRFASALLCLSAWSIAQEASDAPDKTPSDFVRFVKTDDGGHLDTAITTSVKGDVTLVLFGAVHIADAACYALLNDRFTGCEVLLYELVAPPDRRPRKGEEKGFNPLSLLQQGLKNSLGLTFQLDEIDYQASNFVHADMTPQEFEQSMDERGESLLSIMWSMMSGGMQRQAEKMEQAEGAAPAQEFDLVKAFRSREGHHQLRLAFAEQLEEIEMLSAGGKGSTLLEGRNEKCLEVLQREMAAGQKKIGIYYGAAHFLHMEARLVGDLGFRKVAHEWIVAWDCKKRLDPKYDRELVLLRRRALDELTVLAAKGKAYRLQYGSDAVPSMKELAAAPFPENTRYVGPAQDPWGKDYVLRKRPVGGRWEAVSGGQDGVLGTADDLVVIEPRRGGLLGR